MKNNTLKTSLIIVALIVMTVILIEIPAYYYNRKDKTLLGDISVTEYALRSADEELSIKQKIEALTRDDCLVVKDMEKTISDDEKQQKILLLCDEIDEMFEEKQSVFLKDMLNKIYDDLKWKRATIVCTSDDLIYSFDVGMVGYIDSDGNNVGVIYDYDTGKIIHLKLYIASSDSMYSTFELPESREEYISALEEYFDMEISSDNSEAKADENSICASPFSKNEALSVTLASIYDILYNN